MDPKKYCLNIFIDFSKGFDTINQHVLLTKLDFYGGNALGLLRRYLLILKQFVRICNVLSTYRNVRISNELSTHRDVTIGNELSTYKDVRMCNDFLLIEMLQ